MAERDGRGRAGPEGRGELAALIQRAGGLDAGVARTVSDATGVPEAEVYGVGSFFHLLARPEVRVRVCTGLSCQLAGAERVLAEAKASGLPVEGCSCLAACDEAPAVLRERRVLPAVSLEDVLRAGGRWEALTVERDAGDRGWMGHVGPASDPETQAIDLLGAPDWTGAALGRARELGPEGVLEVLKASGLQGRGGAGFPAHLKWRSVCGQAEATRYLVLNADEAEPGTFKDREVMLRRPDAVLEGLAIAAEVIGAQDVYLYLRGAFEIPWQVMEAAIERMGPPVASGGEPIRFHLHAGHGAYICGEETALLESLEGRRGMPRLRPPYPTERGLWGKPTLVHNVETIACLPAILRRGGEWFRGLGRTEAGSKLYCISGHVAQPGTYELPLGVTLDELLEVAGGMVGTLQAFSPGGASAGFLPADQRSVPLDFRSLADAGSMLGSAGVVVLNDTVDMAWAAREQLRFFEDESCGQCAPCRIGTRYLRERVDRFLGQRGGAAAGDHPLRHVADAAWEMEEGSICGLGIAAPLALTTAMKHFPEAFDP